MEGGAPRSGSRRRGPDCRSCMDERDEQNRLRAEGEKTYNSNSFLSETLPLSSRTAASTFCRPLSSVAVTETRCLGMGMPSKLTSRTVRGLGQ